MRNKKLINRRSDITQVWQFCSPKISPCKRKEKKVRKSYYNTGYSYLVTHPSTKPFEQGLNSTLNVFFNFLRREKISKREKILWHCMAWKVENKKIQEYENENYYLLWWSEKRHFPYNCLGLSDEDNLVSRTDNFVNMNVFNSSSVLFFPSWVAHSHFD